MRGTFIQYQKAGNGLKFQTHDTGSSVARATSGMIQMQVQERFNVPSRHSSASSTCSQPTTEGNHSEKMSYRVLGGVEIKPLFHPFLFHSPREHLASDRTWLGMASKGTTSLHISKSFFKIQLRAQWGCLDAVKRTHQSRSHVERWEIAEHERGC